MTPRPTDFQPDEGYYPTADCTPSFVGIELNSIPYAGPFRASMKGEVDERRVSLPQSSVRGASREALRDAILQEETFLATLEAQHNPS